MEGYPRLATLIGRSPETAIFRGFKMLNAQNLLYLQAELTVLEEELEILGELDRTVIDGHLNRKIYHQNWYYLSKSKKDGDDAQWKKALEIREKLDEYNRCLSHFTNLCNLEPPAKPDLAFLNMWLQERDMRNLSLSGRDKDIWEDPKTIPDLVAIKKGKESDAFAKFFVLRILPIFHYLFGKHFKKPVTNIANNGALSEYSDTQVIAVVEVVNTVIACLLPLSSVISLYFISSLLVRLGVIIAYVVIFSLCLALFTRARRVEIFAAVAGFTAVQVVFVSVNGLV